jgi:arylsulfatase A-like enzyme
VATGLPVSSTAPALAAVLQQNGFSTGAFTENTHILPRNGFGRGFDDFWAYWLPWIYDDTLLYRFGTRLRLPFIEFTNKQAFPHPVTRPDQVNWDARTTTDEALAWLSDTGDAPFFAYVHYMGPHGPYGPPEYLLEHPKPSVEVTDHPRPMGGAWPLGEPAAKASDDDIELMRVLYAADIRYVEHHIGRILDWLDKEGKLDETLVVFTSDHGEEFFEHNAWNHGSSAFTEQLRVPLIMMAQDLVPAGLRVAEPTRHVDIVPTVLDLLGIECPEDVQGRSLRPLIEGRGLVPVPVYSEIYPLRPSDCSIYSLVKNGHKLIRVTLGEETRTLLYDLASDPGERTDLTGAKSALVDSFDVEMVTWDRIAHMHTPDSGEVPIDSRRLKMLKSLGYIK